MLEVDLAYPKYRTPRPKKQLSKTRIPESRILTLCEQHPCITRRLADKGLSPKSSRIQGLRDCEEKDNGFANYGQEFSDISPLLVPLNTLQRKYVYT